MKHRWPILLIVFLGLTACSLGGSNKPSNSNRENDASEYNGKTYEDFNLDLSSGSADLARLKMSLTKLGPFYSIFTLDFKGNQDWTYQVETRFDGKSIEYNLEITGVSRASDPGDVRLVNADGINQMIGPGTDQLCVQFPDEMNTGVLFISPVDVINPDILVQDWQIRKNQTYLERDASTHHNDQDFYYGWEDIEADLVVDEKTGAILSYTFDAVGSDPLYGNGGGKIHGEFVVQEIEPQKIEPVSGCEIPVPIPADAHSIVILPGLYSFETQLGPVNMDKFYDQELLIAGWGRDTALVNDEIREGILVYFSETETLTVHIEAINSDDFSEGYLVKLYLEEK